MIRKSRLFCADYKRVNKCFQTITVLKTVLNKQLFIRKNNFCNYFIKFEVIFRTIIILRKLFANEMKLLVISVIECVLNKLFIKTELYLESEEFFYAKRFSELFQEKLSKNKFNSINLILFIMYFSNEKYVV